MASTWLSHSTPSDLRVSHTEILNSWKEVAGYLGRGVRTVQRWEQDLALPVRRPRGKAHSAVIALKSELDHWLLHATNNLLPLATAQPFSPHHDETHVLIGKTRQLLAHSRELCQRSRFLTEQINLAVELACRLSRVPSNKKVSPIVVIIPPALAS
jgi:hypothetical protein